MNSPASDAAVALLLLGMTATTAQAASIEVTVPSAGLDTAGSLALWTVCRRMTVFGRRPSQDVTQYLLRARRGRSRALRPAAHPGGAPGPPLKRSGGTAKTNCTQSRRRIGDLIKQNLWRKIPRRPQIAEGTEGGCVIAVANNSAVRSRG
jgi:hypothetical protein